MLGKKKILIIDDEVDFCLLLKSFYARKGYDVNFSHTLKDGLQSIKNFSPDIVFLDNNLPDGLGWDSAASIMTDFPATELTLISAYKSDYSHLNIPGDVRILEKPLNLDNLNLFY
jgi:DNA-binding response OmpR family regulator